MVLTLEICLPLHPTCKVLGLKAWNIIHSTFFGKDLSLNWNVWTVYIFDVPIAIFSLKYLWSQYCPFYFLVYLFPINWINGATSFHWLPIRVFFVASLNFYSTSLSHSHLIFTGHILTPFFPVVLMSLLSPNPRCVSNSTLHFNHFSWNCVWNVSTICKTILAGYRALTWWVTFFHYSFHCRLWCPF